MNKYKLTIAYDGTPFSGWQIQPNGRSIQQEIETALATIYQMPIKITGSGRTDAGVHAHGQVAHCMLPTAFPALLKSLNSLLPPEISLLQLTQAPPSFHARFSALEKVYTYCVTTTPVQLPHDARYSLHYTYKHDLTRIHAAIPHLLGTHDFSSFANEARRFNEEKSPIKTLIAIDLHQTPTGFTLTFRGNGFLYKMVRNLTGLLLDIARYKLPPAAAAQLLTACDRTLAPAAAPAHALFLTSVVY